MHGITFTESLYTALSVLEAFLVLALMYQVRSNKHLRGRVSDLSRIAFVDPLTNVANRALFMNRLEHALARASRRSEGVAVLFVDLDRFKDVNDTLGHHVGDWLLVQVGARLRDCLRPADTVARIGGDEFTVLIEDNATVETVAEVSRRIISTLSAPFHTHEGRVSISASVGAALSGKGSPDPAHLLSRADTAMYEAKRSGGARYVLDADESGVASVA